MSRVVKVIFWGGDFGIQELSFLFPQTHLPHPYDSHSYNSWIVVFRSLIFCAYLCAKLLFAVLVLSARIAIKMSKKRKKNVLSIEGKLQLIRKILNGASQNQMSLQYGIGESTVRGSCKQKDKFMNFSFTSENISSIKKRKNMKTSTYGDLDMILLQWVRQVRSEITPTSGPIIAAKAAVLVNAKIRGTIWCIIRMDDMI